MQLRQQDSHPHHNPGTNETLPRKECYQRTEGNLFPASTPIEGFLVRLSDSAAALQVYLS